MASSHSDWYLAQVSSAVGAPRRVRPDPPLDQPWAGRDQTSSTHRAHLPADGWHLVRG